MRLGVHLFELSDAHLGVNLGGVYLGVSKLLLDKSYISSVFEHVGGTGVPQQVATATFGNVGGFDVFSHHLCKAVVSEGFKQVG